MKRRYFRIIYLLSVIEVVGMGLLSRRMTSYIPDIIDLFLGDSLWALMVYLLIRTLSTCWSIKKVSIAGTVFCFTIEFSQLYHRPWIDAIRRTTLGGLILGYGFLWSDLAAYLIGIGLGIIVDKVIQRYLFKIQIR